MIQTACQTAIVDQTGELSHAVGHNITIGDEANAGADTARQLVLWELGRNQVTVDFSAGNIVTDTGLLTVRKLGCDLEILAEAAGRSAVAEVCDS